MIGKQQPQNLMIKWMCNDQMKRLVKRMTIEQVLKDIMQVRGMSALRNGDALVGLFQDFSRNQLRPQANALKVFISCKGNTQILNLQNAPLQQQQVQLHRLVQEMTTQHNMLEGTAVEVCSAFWRAAIGTEYPISATSGMTADEMYQKGKQCQYESYKFDRGAEKRQWLLKAIEWYEKAAQQNHLDAQKELGWIYQNILEGTPEDFVKSLFWYRKAAEQGDAEAQVCLGYYYDGVFKGITQDYDQAIYWLKQAAIQNNPYGTLAMNELCYIYGWHFHDHKQSFDWCQRAAERGNIECCHWLGRMYECGFFTSKDSTKALYWYKKAAEKRDTVAMDDLIRCYENGIGDTRNPEQAEYWRYQKARSSVVTVRRMYRPLPKGDFQY